MGVERKGKQETHLNSIRSVILNWGQQPIPWRYSAMSEDIFCCRNLGRSGGQWMGIGTGIVWIEARDTPLVHRLASLPTNVEGYRAKDTAMTGYWQKVLL